MHWCQGTGRLEVDYDNKTVTIGCGHPVAESPVAPEHIVFANGMQDHRRFLRPPRIATVKASPDRALTRHWQDAGSLRGSNRWQ